MTFKIEQIHHAVTWRIRHEVMWPNQPLDFIKLPDDPEGYHLGLYVESQLSGVISIFKKDHSVQFRKLAVISTIQGLGFGKKLIEEATKLAISIGGYHLWCDARQEKADWYKKQGFEQVGDSFLKYGQAYVKMLKSLQ